jgi:DDE superfamily endonuclease
MTEAKQLWEWWQAVLQVYRPVFTRPGWVRFAQWVTGMVLCWEEHTLTQVLTALGLESRWRVLEAFAEYGAWEREAVERCTLRLVEQEKLARWGRYHPMALDDTKLHRTSADVWGTCTFHEPSARSPNRAETVRAHNWVVVGDLVPGQPWTCLPQAARVYLRKTQLPPGEVFQTKPVLAVAMLRAAARESAAPLLAIFDGAYAVRSVVTSCLHPQPGQPRIEILTRLREDARLYRPLGPEPAQRGRPRKWGQRVAAPRRHWQWRVPWTQGQAWIYGRRRRFRYRQLQCQWAVSGPQLPVHVFVFQVAGYTKPWFLVTSALELSAAQVVEAYAARSRQEDTFRDHKQRLGMEECRAWTKAPVLRTFHVQMIALTGLRVVQWRLEHSRPSGQWWHKPPWNPRKTRPSLLDLRRLFWRHRHAFSQFLVELEEVEKLPHPRLPHGHSLPLAA